MTFIPGGCCDDYPECYHRVAQDLVRDGGTAQSRKAGSSRPLGSGCESAPVSTQNAVPPSCHPESYEARACKIQAGDVITIAGVYERPHWWQFWRWFSKPRTLQLFIVQ